MTKYDRELNKGMKVFSQLYVGLKKQSGEKPDLGFATPFEKNAAFQKRKLTVDSWSSDHEVALDENGNIVRDANGYAVYVEVKPRHKMVDNTPRTGFRITDDIKRVYWGGGNVVWRVEDPAGFELEIQSQNLMAIIQTSGIGEGGLIPGNCLWGRDGRDNILLHEKSEEYQNAILEAEKLKTPKHLNSISRVVGTKYLLQNGSTAEYLGKFWVVTDHCEIAKKGVAVQIENVTAHIGQSDKYILGQAVEYDVVREVYEDHLTGRVYLYKKAPLIKQIGEITHMPDEVALSIFNNSTVNFASSAVKGRIVYGHKKKFQKYRYVANPMSNSEFASRLSNIKDRSSYYSTSRRPISAGTLYAFLSGYCSDRKVPILRIADKLYSGFGEVCKARYADEADNKHVVLPIEITDTVAVTNYISSQYSYSYAYGYTVRQDITPEIYAAQIPTFSNVDDVAKWYQQQFDDGNLLKLDVEPVE